MRSSALSLFFAIALPLFAATEDAKTKARELLDSAAQSIGTASPEAQAFTLLAIARNYRDLSPAQTKQHLERAYAIAQSLASRSGDERAQLKAEILKELCEVSLRDTIELLRAAAPEGEDDSPLNQPVEQVTGILIRGGELDRAIETLALMPTSRDYPFHSASLLLTALPPNDSRRPLLFAKAATAYATRPSGPFPELLARHWRTLPRTAVEQAVPPVVNSLLIAEKEPTSGEFIMVEGKNILVDSRTKEILQALKVLEEFSPKKIADYLKAHPDANAAKPAVPEPTAETKAPPAEPESNEAFRNKTSYLLGLPSGLYDDNSAAAIDSWSHSANKLGTLLEAAENKPEQALADSASLPLPEHRLALLSAVSTGSATPSEPAIHRIERAQALVVLIKDPLNRAHGWVSLAEIAHVGKEDRLAWDALHKALDDCASVYTRDTDSEHPNIAFLDRWPSTYSYRQLAYRAARMFGTEAPTILPDIHNPDMLLLAQVEMAQALLGHAGSPANATVSRRD